jgi:hypothetical protein
VFESDWNRTVTLLIIDSEARGPYFDGMNISIRHLPPETKIQAETPSNDLAEATAPSAHEILKRLRALPSRELVDELLDEGSITLDDLLARHGNQRTTRGVESMRENYATSIATADKTFRDFSWKFLAQAKALSGAGIIPIPSDEIESRFKRLSFELIDPIKSQSASPEFETHEMNIRIPVPLTTGSFNYADFVHEAIHGIAGRHVMEFSCTEGAKAENVERTVARTGLHFDIPLPDGWSRHFEWLDEGIVEHLTEHFVPRLKVHREARRFEVDIVKALTNPKGFYKIPLQALTTAYFANFDPTADPGLRYPQWSDLNDTFPIAHLNKIDTLVARFDEERVARLVASRNICKASLVELERVVEGMR